MKKAKFIIIEGGEGSGKSTIVRNLKQKLLRNGYNVCTTREPGGSDVAEGIRNSFINNKLDAMSQLFCFLAARAVWTEQVLIPKLEECDIVITDRSYPSTYVYQGVVGGIDINNVQEINSKSMRGIKPDLVIILNVDAEEGIERSNSTGDTNAFEKEDIEFHKKVNKAYIDLAKKHGWKVINANQPLDRVRQESLDIINKEAFKLSQ